MIFTLPLLHLLLAIVAGVGIAHTTRSASLAVLVSAWGVWVLLAVLLFNCARRRRRAERLFQLWILVGAAMLGYSRVREAETMLDFPDESAVTVTGRITDTVEWQTSDFGFDDETNRYASFTLQLAQVCFAGEHIRAVSIPVRCVLVSARAVPLQRGDRVSLHGRWERYHSPGNPGQFDGAAYYRREGIYFKITAKAGVLLWQPAAASSPILRVRRWLDSLRVRFARVLRVHEGCFVTESSIMCRMLLGLREPLPPDTVELFTRTGTFHIIAISGLHIGIVWGFWWCLTWLVGFPGKVRCAVVVPVMWLYAGMVGLRASVIRAMLMFTMVALAPLCGRPHRAAAALIAAAVVYTIGWPRQLQAGGTLLSYLSVVALVSGTTVIDTFFCRFSWYRGPALYDREHRHYRLLHRCLRYMLRIVWASCAIWLVTWPVIITGSHLVTPSSLLANIILVPVVSLVLVLGFLTILLSLISETLAHLIHYSNLALLKGVLWYAAAVSRLPFGYFAVCALTAQALFWYYFALGISYWWSKAQLGLKQAATPGTRLLSAGMLLGWIAFITVMPGRPPEPTPLTLVCLDVGLGDAAVMHVPGGATILVDGGVRYSHWSQGIRTVIPYLRSRGIDRLDAVICSHFDRDHAGGLEDVLRLFSVKALYAPPVDEDNPVAARLRTLARRKNIAWHTWCAGDSQCWDDLTITVLHPPALMTNWMQRARRWGDNTWSLVLRAEWHGRSVLLTGDATIASEAMQYHCRQLVRSDIIKLGHHGSASSSSRRYLEWVNPIAAVLSCGPNPFGLPAGAVLERLKQLRIPVMRTDRHGAIQYTITTNRIIISTYREPSQRECTK